VAALKPSSPFRAPNSGLDELYLQGHPLNHIVFRFLDVCLSSGVSLVLSDRPGRRVGMEAAFIVRQQLEALYGNNLRHCVMGARLLCTSTLPGRTDGQCDNDGVSS
jgi:hypothetical protein